MSSAQGGSPREPGTEAAGDARERLVEALFAASLLGALTLGITLVLPGGHLALSRPLWLDEYHTRLVAEAPSLARMWSDLAQGADFNPPLLHILVRPLALSGDGLTPVELRTFSFLCVFGALNLVYWTLRQALDGLASLVGTLSVSSHPLVAEQAFSGRFYGPLLLLTALLALLLARPGGWGRWRRVLVALAAVGMCTIHYFGVVALVSMVLGFWSLRSSRQVGAAGWVLMAGPLALALCLPLYLGQRAALPVPTWVPPPSPAWVGAFLMPFATWGPGLAGVLLLAADRWRRARDGTASPLHQWNPRPLLALLAFPLFCVAFSFLVQSVLIPRYSIVTVLAFGPLAALGVSTLRPSLKAVALLLLLLLSARVYGGQAIYGAGWAEMVRDQREEIQRLGMGGKAVVVLERWRFYGAVPSDDPGLDRVRFFAPPAEEMAEGLRATGLNPRWRGLLQVESAAARIHSDLYGYPPVVSPDDLYERESFVVVATPGFLISVADFVRAFFPDFHATPLGLDGDWPVLLHRIPEPPSSPIGTAG